MVNWKKGRGKLGVFDPLIGNWICNKGSKDRMNPECIRSYKYALGKSYIIADITWVLGDKNYEDHTIIGLDDSKIITFWSFTSDGKNSTGEFSEVSDIHELAFGFEANMPAGIARQAFWPDETEGFHWTVESKTKKGWNRFVQQHFVKYEK
ncbi:hypothetical protein [Chryseobacterium sp.]|uniref:hypothetical protein n=1 Tax=Chryseobacterium sp. TaxID=1871047 RepID=UPI0011CA9574|nr:hypothetical protein [Chryseobacterium sp.]TXF74876.1 hypothetical protein FUA25_11335 [Chryseobacterium sp.]